MLRIQIVPDGTVQSLRQNIRDFITVVIGEAKLHADGLKSIIIKGSGQNLRLQKVEAAAGSDGQLQIGLLNIILLRCSTHIHPRIVAVR